MSDRLKSFFFAMGLCVVCSLLLTGASTTLKPAQEKNMQTDRKKNILKAVGLMDMDTPVSPDAVDRLYAERIVQLAVEKAGTIIEKSKEDNGEENGKSQPTDDGILPMYLSFDLAGDGQKEIAAYIIPITSRGLWGKIYGYLALEKDGATIKGFTVYKHSETPGLGGEIENRWFQENFIGKKIVDHNNQFVSVSITKGKASDTVAKKNLPNHVDGISGATLTGQYLTKGLQTILTEYEPLSIRFRQNILQCRMQSDAPSNVQGCENEKE